MKPSTSSIGTGEPSSQSVGKPASRKRSILDSKSVPQAENGTAMTVRESRNSLGKGGSSASKRSLSTDEDTSKHRSCDKALCIARPQCFCGVTERCCGAGLTSRWYHISYGEHFCNDCFEHFYRSHRDGYEKFGEWKRVWSANAKTEGSIKTFMVENYLPFWCQCTRCNKWRQMRHDVVMTTKILSAFECDQMLEINGRIGCDVEEDECVAAVNEPKWISMLLSPPYMLNSPATPFVAGYRKDTVGISVTVSVKENNNQSPSMAGSSSSPSESKVSDIVRPFHQPEGDRYPFALAADHMTLDEQKYFPQYAGAPQMYLALRNIVVSLWAQNAKLLGYNTSKLLNLYVSTRFIEPVQGVSGIACNVIQEVVTASRCIPHIICRGLVRIRCIQELPSIIYYLSCANYINVGVFSGPISDLFPPRDFKPSVIIIGAGPAGLAAAHQLRLVGAQVTVVEARDRIGGRVSDEMFGNVCVGKGTQLIEGCINNPFAILCLQLDIPFITLSEQCVELTECGKVIDGDVNSRMEFHFDAMLDQVAKWKSNATKDASLLEKLLEARHEFAAQSKIQLSARDESLFRFHMANLEYACGAGLDKVSAMNFEHFQMSSVVAGPLALLPHGYLSLMQRLAKGIDIRLNTQVIRVNYSSSPVTMETSNGGQLSADYVLVTVPLTILKTNKIEFTPQLPDVKMSAINSFGIGVLEKVILQFAYRFWASKIGKADFFSCVINGPESNSLFTVFHDATYRAPGGADAGGVLVSFLNAESARVVRGKSDAEIVDLCVESLRKLFPRELHHVKPLSSRVTRWQEDPFAGMAYSYIPVGCSSEIYDQLAAPISNKIFFAGEATNRSHPQTVTGAYLSGLREVRRIMDLQRR